MYTLHFTDNDEVIETKTAPSLDEAVAKAKRLIGGCSPQAEEALRKGEEVFFNDCESIYIRKA